MSERLPVRELEEEIARSLSSSRRLILVAPTGSGKSTQVPQILLERGLLGEGGQVVVLQPRRLAARLLAARVADERSVPLGREVGYQIRLENVTSSATRIRFVTEGILLRQMIGDPSLSGIRAILFDEFHERHLEGDVALARALGIQESVRPDLLLIVMSATLDAARLAAALDPCATLTSDGRAYPVTIEYAATARAREEAPVWERAADAFARAAREGLDGDALVFMPGGYEISRTIEAIAHRPEGKGRVILPLHGELSPGDQDAAVGRHQRPKVVVSTNVAETSLTIDGVRLVIDSGMARIPRHDPGRGVNMLFVERISRASADQRAGRAGRTAPGRCIRLWSEREHADRPARETPEIRRLDLSEVALALKASGVHDLRAFRWIDPPEPAALERAEELLADLGALDAGGRATPLGRKLLAFPLHPRLARMLVAAHDLGCVRDAALLAALSDGRDLLLRRIGPETARFRERIFGDLDRGGSDFLLLRRAWEYAAENGFRLEACRQAGIHAASARQVGPTRDQFLGIARDLGLDTRDNAAPETALRRCLLTAFPDRIARRVDAGTLRCELVHGTRATLARESAARDAPLLVAAEARELEGRPGTGPSLILSLAAGIERAWLEEVFPGETRARIRVSFDPSQRRVFAENQEIFRGLTLGARAIDPPPAEEAARLLADEVLAGRIALERWDDGVEQWITRLNCLARWCPELDLPPIGDSDRRALVEQICHGALSHRDIRDREVAGVIRSWLSPAAREALDRHAPERAELPNGRRPKITYSPEHPPWIALAIQELYGVDRTPRIAFDRVPVVTRILAPNRRPLQITEDLAGFWRDHYPRAKQELQRRYPKHEWR